MKIKKSYLQQIILEELSHLNEKCWPGYTQKGMKTMFGKRYPNCVKKKKVNEGDVIGFGTLKQRQEFRGVFAETKDAITKLQNSPRPSKKRNTEETYKELSKNRFEAAKNVMKNAVSLAKFHLQNIAGDPQKMEDFYKEFYLAFMKSGFAWPLEPARIAVIKDRAIAYFENNNKTIPIERIFGNLFPKDLAETSYDVDNLTRVLLAVAGVGPEAINEYIKIFFRDR